MLQNLFIKNYALINELNLEIDGGLTTITGETGAGKSILLGAIGLVLGQRADTSAIADQTEKCIIEATFDVSKLNLQILFDELEFDYQDITIIRREILPNGKSRSFVNDTPANLSNLKNIANHLIEIHTQHTGLLVTDPIEQLKLIDGFGNHSSTFDTFRNTYSLYNQLTKKLNDLIEHQNQFFKEKEFIQFQFDELEQLNLKPNEEIELEEKINVLTQASNILQSVGVAKQIISDNEHSIIDQLNSIKNQLRAVSSINQPLKDLFSRIESSIIELKDIGAEAESIGESIEQNPSELEKLNERLAKIQNLFRKHQVDTCNQLIELSEKLEEKLLASQNQDQDIESIQKQLNDTKVELLKVGKQLSESRKNAAEKIKSDATAILKNLAIPNAEIQFKLESKEDYLNQYGLDKVDILFSANLGKSPQPLSQVASGGEISRLNFTFRSLIAKNKNLPTLIYDEADTGISGEIASKMGSMMRQLGQFHQVISITHLPQVAASGQNQWLVYKSTQLDKTHTSVKKLSGSERIHVIAQMLSGTNPSEVALQNAQELIKLHASL